MNDSNDFDLDDYDAPKDFKTELRFNDISIKIIFDIEESKKHIQNDYYVINNEGLDKIILEKFIPWLKGKDYLDRDNQKILEGLQLYEITYHYKKICDEYYPTGKEDYFGEFEFCFENGNDYVDDMLESFTMQVYIHNNNVIKVSVYDI